MRSTLTNGRLQSELSIGGASEPELQSLMPSLGRVLVVEDETQVALVLNDALQDFGYEVRVAVTGPEALQLAAGYEPAVVLLDLWLPGLQGEAVLEGLQQVVPTVPVVIVSGNRDVERARALLMRGAFDYLMKPFELPVLERVVMAAVVEYERRQAS